MTFPTLIHIHIPKSAGTTINAVLGSMLQGKHHFAYSIPGNSKAFHAMPQAERDQIDFLFGHFPYGLHNLFSRPVNYIASLREPRRRILSLYRFILMYEDYPLHDVVKNQSDDFSSFLTLAASDPRVQAEVDNIQVRMISGRMNLAAEYDDSLSLALSNLNAGNFFVADTENLSSLFLQVQRAYHVNHGFIPRLNSSNEGLGFEEEMDRVRPQAKKCLEHFTKWDTILHDMATNTTNINCSNTGSLSIVETTKVTTARQPLHEKQSTTVEDEWVRALYRVLLFREPDPHGFAAHVQKVRDGHPPEEIMQGFLRSQEFFRKQARFAESYFDLTELNNNDISKKQIFFKQNTKPSLISDLEYRCPSDLTVTPLSLRRIIVVGQCLLVAWPNVIEKAIPNCKCDFFLFNKVQQLPENPPAEVSDYNFQLIGIPLRSVLPDATYFRLSYGEPEAYEDLFHECCYRIRQFLTAAMRWNREQGLLTFVTNFIVPQQNPMGRLLPRYDLRNLAYFVEKLNETLAEELKSYNNTFLFDLDQIMETFGRKYFQDDMICITTHNGMLSDYDFEFDQDRLEPPVRASAIYERKVELIYELGWKELLTMYRTIRQLDMVKLVVMDIDDTLWRGVAAERTDHSGEVLEGWPIGLAEALGHLKRRGVLLALISKNEEKLIVPIWQCLFENRLCLDDFAIRKINWRPKSENFEEILEETNLLPHSTVYIDDNPVERAAIEAAFPGVRTFGPNPLVWRRILLWSAETQVATITKESAARTEMVRAQVERETQRKQLSREEFLATLNVEVAIREIDKVDHPEFPRALELINKSNQFNTTGKRWTKQECYTSLSNKTRFFIFDVKDRFTQYGIVGVIIVKNATIIQFVMSCRVVGMEVEIAAIIEIIRIIRKEFKLEKVIAHLEETELNLLARDLWQRCGFELDAGQWVHCRSSELKPPPHIKISVATDVAPALASVS